METKEILPKLLESTLIITVITAATYIWGYSFLTGFYAVFGIPIDALNLSINQVMVKSFWLVVFVLVMCLLRSDQKKHFENMDMVRALAIPIAVSATLTVMAPLIGWMYGTWYIAFPPEQKVNMIVDTVVIDDYYLLDKNDGTYFLYRPKTSIFTPLPKKPDLLLIKEDAVKVFVLH